jgi:4-amino-4-deoxy-L-arabinose transferase-like glycosyltransferase
VNIKITAKHLWGLLAVALLLRLISLGLYPLMDTTEARYGEMARLMVETGNWLTPQFDYGVPFWGKPPLFTWMSATGVELFGLSEFSLRAPHWLASVLVIGLIGYVAKREGFNWLVASIVLATCGIFSIAAGAVMTDMALTLGMAMAMVGFYYCWLEKEKGGIKDTWGYFAFAGLAIGLLAKGPVVIVIMGLAVFPWLVLQHGLIGAFVQLWQRFPIVKGLILMLVIALPWYILAERATPGFIDYFIVGEHFKRFVVSGWEGDLYGSAHDEPRGMIWLFWLQSAAPWSIALPILAWFRRDRIKETNQSNKGLFSFAIFWLISPLLMFTMSGNILPAYVLPGIPALGIIAAIMVVEKDWKWFSVVSLILPIVLLIALILLNTGMENNKSDRVFFESQSEQLDTYYARSRPFSGQYYSSGKAIKVTTPEEIKADEFYLIGRERHMQGFLGSDKLECQLQLEPAGSRRSMYRCSTVSNEAN